MAFEFSISAQTSLVDKTNKQTLIARIQGCSEPLSDKSSTTITPQDPMSLSMETLDEHLDIISEKRVSGYVRGFLWDFLSLVLVTASLLALVGTLLMHDGKEIPKWSIGTLGVTLYTIISIISTVFRCQLPMASVNFPGSDIESQGLLKMFAITILPYHYVAITNPVRYAQAVASYKWEESLWAGGEVGSAQYQTCNFRAPGDPTLQHAIGNASKWDNMRVAADNAHYILNRFNDVETSLIDPYANTFRFFSMIPWVKGTSYKAEVAATASVGVYTEHMTQRYTYEEVDDSPITPITVDESNYSIFNIYKSDMSPLVFKPPFANDQPNQNNTFVLPYFAYYIITSLFVGSDLFNGEVSTGTGNGISGPDGPLLFFQADNVTRAMHNVARYMTIAMHSNATTLLQQTEKSAAFIASEESAKGIVYIQQQMVFRSSPLTLLFHGRVSEEVREYLWKEDDSGSVRSSKGMQDIASVLRAKIHMDENGLIDIYFPDNVDVPSAESVARLSLDS
ncbi:hypothetical protein RRF57_007673 [Xylaria bambusicola]|uniref:Uncharacterized protein n=1 Tax=Xylaria bambusicola TaxID=326684 RepID=A0AAN7UQV1_9PEZI